MQLQKIKIKNCKNKVTQKSSTERVQKNRKNRKIKIAQNLVQLKKVQRTCKKLVTDQCVSDSKSTSGQKSN